MLRESSSIVNVDPDVARRLLVDGATFLFLGVPTGTEFGIDMKSWNTGEKFKGVKMIPPGIHYLHYSATNKFGDMAPRVGFVHNFKQSEFMVKKWDSEMEEISLKEVLEDEVNRLQTNLLNLDQYLGVYPYDVWWQWKQLTSQLTEPLMSRLVPLSADGVIRSALELRPVEGSHTELRRRRSRPRTEDEREQELLPDLRPQPGTELRFTPLPDRSYPEGSTPAQVTRHSLDPTYRLDALVKACNNSVHELIGELQFSFVSFLVGHSLEALEHWRTLVCLLCTSEAALVRRRELYSLLLTALEAQLAHIPEDFLVDIVANTNLVYQSLRTLFRNVRANPEVDGRLRSEMERVQDRLSVKFQWDFSGLEREEDDEAPVVVEL